MDIRLPGTPNIAQGKHVGTVGQEESRTQRSDRRGLVGLVNIGNSCYMNATLQALSNCPPFRQYFVDILHANYPHSSDQTVSAVLSNMFKRMWAFESHPGHMSPRVVSSAMKQRMFKGSQQQDAQEFLRCLLTQIHDEIGIQVPPAEEWLEGCGHGPPCSAQHRDSMASCDSDTSADSHSSRCRLVGRSPSLSRKKPDTSSPLPESETSPATRPKVYNKYVKIHSSTSRGSCENIHQGSPRLDGIKELGSDGDTPRSSSRAEAGLQWSDSDVFVADLITRNVRVHRSYLRKEECVTKDSKSAICQAPSPSNGNSENASSELEKEEGKDEQAERQQSDVDSYHHGEGEVSRLAQQKEQSNKQQLNQGPSSAPTATPQRSKQSAGGPQTSSIVSQVFEGMLESKVKCLTCRVVSITREPFQDLSLPIPGRKEMEKFGCTDEEGEEKSSGGDVQSQNDLSQKMCSIWNVFKSFFLEPPTNIYDCLHAFFDTSELKGDNRYYCSNCKSFQNSQKEMSIVSLPEVLCIHLKRFRFDAYFSSKISRHISFPVTKLDMAQYLKTQEHSKQSCTYDLNAVITHYGGASGGHYVTFAKNSSRNEWYEFNDTRVAQIPADSIQGMEGYVLFYRRVPPSDSLSLQPVSTTALLPPSGTTLPSPDVCYISRHWLHLLRHFAYPGPIAQYDFACRHGAVHPIFKKEEAHALALGVRKEVWERFRQLYKGGPFVQQLEVCQECKDMMDQLNERRKVEKDYVHKVQLEEKKVGAKVEHFILPLAWIHHWQHFINCTSLDVKPPVAIDNTTLIQQVKLEDGAESYNLYDGVPLRKVSQAAWQFFHRIYGGGPVLVSNLDSLQTPVV